MAYGFNDDKSKAELVIGWDEEVISVEIRISPGGYTWLRFPLEFKYPKETYKFLSIAKLNFPIGIVCSKINYIQSDNQVEIMIYNARDIEVSGTASISVNVLKR